MDLTGSGLNLIGNAAEVDEYFRPTHLTGVINLCAIITEIIL